MKQSWQLALRDLRSRQVKVMLAALLIAVTTVAGIQLFASGLQQTLMTSASEFLAADRQLRSRNSEPVAEEIYQRAESLNLRTARMTTFSTMLSHADEFQLVAVKAVTDDYPLLGELEWQSSASAQPKTSTSGPPVGEAWLSPRLSRLLSVQPGDSVRLGEKSLKVTGLILQEPDNGLNFSALAPRLLMHHDDVAATGVIQPGSRVNHRALFAGEAEALASLKAWLTPQLQSDYRWRDVRDGDTLSGSLEKAERFLLLGGSLAVLLAVVAIAVASREYALGQRDQVALLKTLGQTGRQIARSYLSRLVIWGALASAGGLILALGFAHVLMWMASAVLDRSLEVDFRLWSVWPAVVTVMVALMLFAYPPIAQLRHTPAMRVLRSLPTTVSRSFFTQIAVAIMAVFGLLYVYVGDGLLVGALLLGLLVLTGALWLSGRLLLKLMSYCARGSGLFNMALRNMWRHRQATLSQICVFALTVMLAAILLLTRSSLLADWQAQLPEDTPNHFLLNISERSLPAVENFLEKNTLSRSDLYPIVRGRLTRINDKTVTEVLDNHAEIGALNRELSLTAAQTLPTENQIIRGKWFDQAETAGLSIESSLAERLNVGLGDKLGFQVGEQAFSEEIISIRSLEWDSLRPNFYIIFAEEGPLSSLPRTWLTAFFLPPTDKAVLDDFVREFPTISILEIDHIIEQIQNIIQQVTRAVEAILLMVLLAAMAVMVAVVSATISERQREGALMRTLGAQQKLLTRTTVTEFVLIGLIAGLFGVLAAEAVVWILQYRLFEADFRWHPEIIVSLPVITALLLAFLGRWQLQPVLSVSPMRLLRRLE